jgi:hypothetical protein
MRLETVRNVAIVAAIAAIVAFVPAGNESASFASQLINITFAIVFAFVGLRLYQMFRTDIYGLGDRWRGILYASIGLAVFAMAARPELVDTAAGTLGFVTMIVAAGTGLYVVWQRYRSYRV